MAATQRVVIGGESTWTVVSKSFAVVEPIESYLEFGRQGGLSADMKKCPQADMKMPMRGQ